MYVYVIAGTPRLWPTYHLEAKLGPHFPLRPLRKRKRFYFIFFDLFCRNPHVLLNSYDRVETQGPWMVRKWHTLFVNNNNNLIREVLKEKSTKRVKLHIINQVNLATETDNQKRKFQLLTSPWPQQTLVIGRFKMFPHCPLSRNLSFKEFQFQNVYYWGK